VDGGPQGHPSEAAAAVAARAVRGRRGGALRGAALLRGRRRRAGELCLLIVLSGAASSGWQVGGPRGPPMDLDGVLAGGDRGAVTRLARGLARCISLECCGPPDSAEGGERFSWVVGGAFSEPPRVSFPWPQGQT